MPYELTPIKGSGRKRTPLADIPDDVVLAVEEAFEYCQVNPERLELKFATQDEADDFLHHARSYCYHRGSIKGKVKLSLAGNSTQKGAARFRVETPATATGATS
jgi:hypothetical protein